jgi:molybdopterin/thiamine biosynthesis adenylyltransferase/proteasome lid subunit RPN8/RPN11
MSATLAMGEELFRELAAALSEPRETAGFIVAGQAVDEGEATLFARAIHWVPEQDYIERHRGRLTIGSQAIVAGLKSAALDGSIAIFFHTHPGGTPTPSRHDQLVDRQLREPAQIRTGIDLYASLIFGGNPDGPSFSGQLFRHAESVAIERLRIVGPQLRLLSAAEVQPDIERFDRQIRAFGASGQRMLSDLHVGVVGAGGTGSAVFELLARLGVGRITVIDDDRITESNLTRIHESGVEDVGREKVEVAATAAARIGAGSEVISISGRITDIDVARLLRHCDLVFGCTDDHAGRGILSRLAYWYLAPVIDTAFMVDTDGGSVRGLFGRVTTLYPGAPCLICRGRIDLAQVAAEGLPAQERERLAGEGYVPGLGEPDPSVGAYTTLVASLAVSEMLDRLFGLSGEEEPAPELLLRLHDRAITKIVGEPRVGHYCVERDNWGRGDAEPLMGQLWADSAND